MKAEVRRRIAGQERVFSMPLEGVEDVSRVNDMPRQLGVALASGYAKQTEVFAVVEAGAKYGNAGVGVREVYDEIGLAGMEKLALDLWLAAWKDDSGNFRAARETPEKSPSA